LIEAEALRAVYALRRIVIFFNAEALGSLRTLLGFLVSGGGCQAEGVRLGRLSGFRFLSGSGRFLRLWFLGL
jgi:hypothetical protein